MPTPDDPLVRIDEQMSEWRQGDVILGDVIPFVRLADFTRPITPEAEEAARHAATDGDQLGTVATNVAGVLVLTQSCDVVRSCRTRPFVTVAALVEVDTLFLQQVKQGTRPRYLYVPGIADRRLIADLDSTTTVEKALLAGIPAEHRVRGCRTDQEARDLATSLAYSLSRAAFPDDFVSAVKPMQQRIRDKHGKPTVDSKGRPTNEGSLLKSLREIRVMFIPSCDATPVEITFLFLFDDRADVPTDGEFLVENLVKRFKSGGRFPAPTFRIVTLTEITAATYIASDRLDLEYLSSPPVDAE